MKRDISNSDDVLDSRDVIERIAALEELAAAVKSAKDDLAHCHFTSDEEREFAEGVLETAELYFGEDEQAELTALKALQDEGERCADWRDGATLVRDSYFKEYAQQLADDIGAINSDSEWPNNCIDWDKAARELRMDYSSIEFGHATYWVRS